MYKKPITKINLAKTSLSFNKERGFSFDQSSFIFNKDFINIFLDKMYIGREYEKEELESFIDRKLHNVCQLLHSRKSEVDKSISRLNSKSDIYLDKNQCLKKEHYGSYSTPSRDKAIYDEINKLEKTEIEEFKYYNYEEKYRPLVLLAGLLLLIELVLRFTVFRSFV